MRCSETMMSWVSRFALVARVGGVVGCGGSQKEAAAPAAPAGFARRAAPAWAAEQAAAAAPILGATWMRAAAAAALLAGIALGSTLSYSSSSEPSADGADSWQSTSLSEEYLAALSAPEAILALPAGANDSPGVAADEPLANEP